jgi:hypothetical protein
LAGALVLTGCQRVHDFWETEPDNSAEGLSGTWEVVAVLESDEDCTTVAPVDDAPNTVAVTIVAGEASAKARPRGGDDDPDAGEMLDVEACFRQDCGPIAGRYSLFDKTERGWRLGESSAQWSRYPACLARRVEATLVALPEHTARIEQRRFVGGGMVEGQEDCDREYARERQETLECTYRKVYELRRPADELD